MGAETLRLPADPLKVLRVANRSLRHNFGFFQTKLGGHMATREKVFKKGVQGKIVDCIVLSDDTEEMALEVRFTDNTSFNVRLAPGQVQVKGVDVLAWKAGNSRVIRKLL
jgi:hypothetical protein